MWATDFYVKNLFPLAQKAFLSYSNYVKNQISHPLTPIFNAESRILILGTMPSPASRKNGFYYGHPQNRFWHVLSAVFEKPMPLTNDEKREFVRAHKIALWDVLASCSITGAADSSIQNPIPNDFSYILAQTKIERIYTTGKKAYTLYTQLCEATTMIPAIVLPSTSPANRAHGPLEKLISDYAVLRL